MANLANTNLMVLCKHIFRYNKLEFSCLIWFVFAIAFIDAELTRTFVLKKWIGTQCVHTITVCHNQTLCGIIKQCATIKRTLCIREKKTNNGYRCNKNNKWKLEKFINGNWMWHLHTIFISKEQQEFTLELICLYFLNLHRV